MQFYRYAQSQEAEALQSLQTVQSVLTDWSGDSADNLEATSLRNRVTDIVGHLLEAASNGVSEGVLLEAPVDWPFNLGKFLDHGSALSGIDMTLGLEDAGDPVNGWLNTDPSASFVPPQTSEPDDWLTLMGMYDSNHIG